MSLPTEAETYSQLMEHLHKAQECSAMLAHITRDNDQLKAQGWLACSEMFKKIQHQVMKLAVKRMH